MEYQSPHSGLRGFCGEISQLSLQKLEKLDSKEAEILYLSTLSEKLQAVPKAGSNI